MSLSVVHYYGKMDSKCGYCKGSSGSLCHGLHAYRLTPKDYQDLIDRGWRRSGHYCYKPIMNTTCCPLYTIKCDALEFKLSKSQKKILKRMNRFLKEGIRETEDKEGEDMEAGKEGASSNTEPEEPKLPLPELNLKAIDESNVETRLNKDSLKSENDVGSSVNNIYLIPKKNEETLSKDSFKSNESMLPPKKKAKQIRLERKQAKMQAKGITSSDLMPKPNRNQEKTLKEYFIEESPTNKHRLKIKLIPSQRKPSEEAFVLYRKYQTIIHNDPPSKVTPSSLERFLYQSPIQHTNVANGPPSGFGSFHQQYWLDDKLIAVGVIDILPFCVSSVYFFYDPAYSFLSLGTYGSLREIAFVQELCDTVPSLRFYYMGFYLHSCPKMRYKGKLNPSYLLCPETYSWHPLTDEIRLKLDEIKYQRLAEDKNLKDGDEFKENDLNNVPMLARNTIIRYGDFIQSFKIKKIDQVLDAIKSRIYKEITGEADGRLTILEYAKLVGKSCATRIVLEQSSCF